MQFCLKSPVSPVFTQALIQVQVKENIKAPHHWPLWGEFTGDRWIPRTNGQWRGKCFHLMMSSYVCWVLYTGRGLCHTYYAQWSRCPLSRRALPFLPGSLNRHLDGCDLLNLKALKFQCMAQIYRAEFQRIPLKFHTKYLTLILKNLIHRWKFKSSYI